MGNPVMSALKLGVFALTAMAAVSTTNAEVSGEVSMFGSEVLFTPAVSGYAQSISVSCAGGYQLNREYDGNAQVAFSPRNAGGAFPAQDSCKFTMRVHPAPDPRLTAAEEANDDEMVELLSQLENEQTHTIRGSFQVEGGQILADTESTERNTD